MLILSVKQESHQLDKQAALKAVILILSQTHSLGQYSQ